MTMLAVLFKGFFAAPRPRMTGNKKSDEGSRIQKKNLLFTGSFAALRMTVFYTSFSISSTSSPKS